jgi:hypothetical protein
VIQTSLLLFRSGVSEWFFHAFVHLGFQNLCTAQISKFQQKVGKTFRDFFQFLQNRHWFTFFGEICIDFE